MLTAWVAVIDAIELQSEYPVLDGWILEFEELKDLYNTLSDEGVRNQVACAILKALCYRQPQHPDIEKLV